VLNTVYRVHSGTLQYLGLDKSWVPIETLEGYPDVAFSCLVCQRVRYAARHRYAYSFERLPSSCGPSFPSLTVRQLQLGTGARQQ
jgi:hypothetical protein